MKTLILWISMTFMLGLSSLILFEEIMLPQKEITLQIDVKNKVNICLENEKIAEK